MWVHKAKWVEHIASMPGNGILFGERREKVKRKTTEKVA